MKYLSCLLMCTVMAISPTLAQKKQKGFTQKQHQKALQHNYKAIKAAANNKHCHDPNEFAYAPLGVNACGGVKEYIIYSKKIDTKEFLAMVGQYNNAEAAFNKKWNIAGTCAIAPVPVNIKCNGATPQLVH